MTTWVKSGVNRANTWRKNEASRTSLSKWRYLITAGMNQVKSNLRSCGRRFARFANNKRSPVQFASNCSRDTMRGRPSAGSWINAFSSSLFASTTYRPSRNAAIAGNGVADNLRHPHFTVPALRPKCLAARNRSVSQSRCPDWAYMWRSCDASAGRS